MHTPHKIEYVDSQLIDNAWSRNIMSSAAAAAVWPQHFATLFII